MQFVIIFIIICLVAIYWKQLAAFAVVFVALCVFLYLKSSKKLGNVFNKWEKSIHDTPEQKIRVYRALHDNLSICRFTGNESAEIVGTSGEIYQVTLQNCTCPDFEERQQPCKHMYFLAKELKKVSKLDLQFYSEEPKKQKKEQHTVHGNKFDFIVTSYETEERPTKRVKLNNKAIDKIIAQKGNNYYGYIGIYKFNVWGINEKTNRRKKIEVKATSEQEAVKKAKENGILPPYEFENIQINEPYEEKIEYAKSLGIKVPEKCSREDIYALIDQVEGNDTILVSPDFLNFSRKREIYFSSFRGEKSAYTIVFYALTGVDKIAMFAFMIYKYITKDIATNFEDCRYKDKFIEFAQQQLENAQFMKSFDKHCSYHEYKTFVHFGPYIDEDGIKQQGICSPNTIIYKTTVEFLKQNNMI